MFALSQRWAWCLERIEQLFKDASRGEVFYHSRSSRGANLDAQDSQLTFSLSRTRSGGHALMRGRRMG